MSSRVSGRGDPPLVVYKRGGGLPSFLKKSRARRCAWNVLSIGRVPLREAPGGECIPQQRHMSATPSSNERTSKGSKRSTRKKAEKKTLKAREDMKEHNQKRKRKRV
jgi:hypothetical protein